MAIFNRTLASVPLYILWLLQIRHSKGASYTSECPITVCNRTLLSVLLGFFIFYFCYSISLIVSYFEYIWGIKIGLKFGIHKSPSFFSHDQHHLYRWRHQLKYSLFVKKIGMFIEPSSFFSSLFLSFTNLLKNCSI